MRVWRKLLFALTAVLAVALVAEAVTRVAFPGLARHAETMQFTNPHRDQPESFDRDPVLFWALRPNNPMWSVNEAGYRGPLRPMAKPAGALRICCLGDSCTFGLGTPPLSYQQTYAARSETILREALHRPVEVLNFGCPGYSSFQGRKLLETIVVNYHPDIVTAYFGINDGFPAIGFPDAEQRPWETPPGWVGTLQRLMRHSDFYVLLTHGLTWARRANGKEEIPRVSPLEFRQNLQAMKRLGAEHGFQVIFVPAFYLNDQGALEREAAGLNEEQAQVDLARYFAATGKRPAELFYPAPDRVHPTAPGHEAIARALADEIVKMVGNNASGVGVH